MMISILGANSFIGNNLFSFFSSHEIIKVSLRQTDWSSQIKYSEILINLIGKAHDHQNLATEQEFFYVNVSLTKDIFNEFINSEAKLLIHVSSLAALEEFESIKPLDEEEKCNPNSWYGKSKLEAELWLMNQNIPPHKKIIILRPPMIHGVGDKGNLGLLYKLISKGIPYPLSSFKNKRSFLSIDNFNFFIEKIVQNYESLDSGIYHVADDESLSTNELISVIKKVENKSIINLAFPKFVIKGIAIIGDYIPIPLNSIRLKKMTSDLEVSNQKIKTALGIDKLPLTAEAGLIKTIKSFKNK
ncbi:Nucleoside-diphosphate-sugar epimerase [Chishuiella changwenlii]|uniref:Nucleoside-diphosphate-sugar epimerase n=1 Tax=Chishuiella changwenlii TaxID=1434701 RepID=A0A1M7A554_9FLAO|nr:NAD-dependent epimerase/dehydratase family protein [Chishuiella changwenlii]GGE91580.1 nucleoside-diphosphate-sugar epimerase [Chishuiella changwenlii]SHL37780.1 Nucleoside-diphosphate-sugar epimerase [Chishuiella changwenlii]